MFIVILITDTGAVLFIFIVIINIVLLPSISTPVINIVGAYLFHL